MKAQDGKPAAPVRLVKLTAEIPADVETRLHALAGVLGVPKRALLGKLVDAGLRRYEVDAAHRELIAGLVRPVEPAAQDRPLKMTGS
jgi:hypothetical protein